MEEKATRAYDLAALKYWGSSTHINFLLDDYTTQIEEMKNMNRQEYVAHLRRKSSGFSRGASIYRGVTRHHQHGRWQARIGRVAGNKDLYLGTFGVIFSWMNPLMKLGYQRPLTEKDIWKLDTWEQTENFTFSWMAILPYCKSIWFGVILCLETSVALSGRKLSSACSNL